MEPSKVTSVNSRAEELFVQLFCEAFGPEKTENLQVQYPCVDIYGRHRYIDFALESPESKIAIEIDGETYHNPSKVSENKYADDLLKQNSLIYDNWKVYRWIYSQLEKQPEKVKDELITFLGTSPMFKAFEADLPVQMGQTIELRDYQQEATENLQKMREDGKTIALLYHATGVGKTITAATDAKAVGGRTLFLVNALKLASQAKETFAKVWPEATLGEYTGSQKDMTQMVIFATVQSISKDLESKLFIPERNQLIVDTYLKYVNGKKTVIFCASVDHAAEIAKLLRDSGVKAEAVSGRNRVEVREKILKDYETGSTNVLCACDLLNEGWDSPHTTVLFMARPTMSKTIYLQQLGRGTRRCPGKEDLLVVDFVDNANMFNMPYSLHRVLDIAKYQPMAYVLAPENKRKLDQDMLFQGEKPEAWLDVPIDVSDYEIIDLFNWQNSVKDMISQIEFVRMVDVQSETVERYIKDGKVKPDLSIPFGDKRMFHYFREESIHNIAKQYGWDLITPQNMADKFMKFIETMDMSFSYKPVLLKAIYEYMDSSGRVALPDVVDYFIDFYEDRKAHGMIAEKSTSIYQKGGYTRKDVEKNILSNPFKRFEDMRFLMRCKDVETIEVNPIIFRKLTREDWLHIVDVCDKSLEKYYLRLKK